MKIFILFLVLLASLQSIANDCEIQIQQYQNFHQQLMNENYKDASLLNQVALQVDQTATWIEAQQNLDARKSKGFDTHQLAYNIKWGADQQLQNTNALSQNLYNSVSNLYNCMNTLLNQARTQNTTGNTN